MRYATITVLFIVLLLTVSCAAQTQYVLKIDALANMSESGLQGSTMVPRNSGLVIYMLPSIQLDTESSGPDARSREGIRIVSPMPSPPDQVRLTVRIDGRLMLENDGQATIPGSEVTGYIAEADAALYPDGTEAGSKEYPAIRPGEEQALEFAFLVDQDSPAYSILSQGLFRIGIKIWIYPPLVQDASVYFTVEELTIEVSGYPFGFIE